MSTYAQCIATVPYVWHQHDTQQQRRKSTHPFLCTTPGPTLHHLHPSRGSCRRHQRHSHPSRPWAACCSLAKPPQLLEQLCLHTRLCAKGPTCFSHHPCRTSPPWCAQLQPAAAVFDLLSHPHTPPRHPRCCAHSTQNLNRSCCFRRRRCCCCCAAFCTAEAAFFFVCAAPSPRPRPHPTPSPHPDHTWAPVTTLFPLDTPCPLPCTLSRPLPCPFSHACCSTCHTHTPTWHTPPSSTVDLEPPPRCCPHPSPPVTAWSRDQAVCATRVRRRLLLLLLPTCRAWCHAWTSNRQAYLRH